jgi:hypothetical protein
MSSPDWRLQPLQVFWQSVNWENQAIAPTNSSNGKVPQALSFLMSVRDYFKAISWNGIPEIAAPAEIQTPITPPIDPSKETLDDFLDDVYKFF